MSRAGRPCSPGSPSRQQRRVDPGKRLQGGKSRVDQSSEVVSRYLSLACPNGAASRRLSCVVSALGYEAVGITHSLPSTEHVDTCWWQKRGELRHRGVQDRIKALKAVASHEGPIVLPVLTQYITKRSTFNRII